MKAVEVLRVLEEVKQEIDGLAKEHEARVDEMVKRLRAVEDATPRHFWEKHRYADAPVPTDEELRVTAQNRLCGSFGRDRSIWPQWKRDARLKCIKAMSAWMKAHDLEEWEP